MISQPRGFDGLLAETFIEVLLVKGSQRFIGRAVGGSRAGENQQGDNNAERIKKQVVHERVWGALGEREESEKRWVLK